VNKIQQKKPLGLNLGKQKQAKILLSHSDKKEIRAFLKMSRIELYFERQKLDFAAAIGWRAISQLAVWMSRS